MCEINQIKYYIGAYVPFKENQIFVEVSMIVVNIRKGFKQFFIIFLSLFPNNNIYL